MSLLGKSGLRPFTKVSVKFVDAKLSPSKGLRVIWNNLSQKNISTQWKYRSMEYGTNILNTSNFSAARVGEN